MAYPYLVPVDHDGDEPLNVAADAPSPQSISNLMSPPPSTSRNFDPLSPGDMNASQRSGQGSRDVSFNVPHGLGPNVFGGTQKTRGSSHSGSPNRSNLFRTPQQNRSKRKNDPLDFMSPMQYGGDTSRNVAHSPMTTPGRALKRVDVGGGMNVPSRAPPRTLLHGADEPELVVWGTSVNIAESIKHFRTFLENFRITGQDNDEEELAELGKELSLDGEGVLYYMEYLENIRIKDQPQLDVNCRHLKQYNEKMYHQLIAYPQEVIMMFDKAVTELFYETYPNDKLSHPIQVRPYNLHNASLMRLLNPEDIDRLISIHGMVIRVSNLMPELREALFMCSICEHRVKREIIRGKISEPSLCPNCHSTYSYSVQHNLSRFSDVQIAKVQESQEDMPPGQTPHTILVYVHDNLVDSVQAGDRIVVTGVYRAIPIRPNPRQQVIRAVYKTNIDVVHFHRKDKRRQSEKEDRIGPSLSEERMAEIATLSRRLDIYDRLSSALAPSIFGFDDIKKGVLLQLLGGRQKDFSNVGRGRPRNEINILLCGDPGTSKSQMLQYAHKIAPRGQYTSGKGSSAVGLTAYVTRDPDTRQFVLQSGALVLSDNGICCIDEFDKMSESTRSVLHEVMEQQTLSVAKAGIICQLNARTSVLAAANPVESQWNKDKTIIDNIQLPHTLLSRFDLIFLVLDPQDEKYDSELAKHLIKIYWETAEEAQVEEVDTNLLRDYIAYARDKVFPVLDDEAAEVLVDAYRNMRRIGKGRGQISAYPRQLESLIRLAEARAKVRLSFEVTKADVEEAIRLHTTALQQAATDPLTGKIDVSILATGMSAAARQRRAQLASLLREYLQVKLGPGTLPLVRVFEEFRPVCKISYTRDQFEDALKDLGEGVVTVVGRNIRVA